MIGERFIIDGRRQGWKRGMVGQTDRQAKRGGGRAHTDRQGWVGRAAMGDLRGQGRID